MVTETRKSTVLDQDGKPLKVTTLIEEQATPTRTGVRSAWTESVAGKVDPPTLARILKSANEGDNRELLALAEEMEERDLHYSSVLGQRKRAVSGIQPTVTPASKSAQDKEIADAVEKLITAPIFADMIDNLLDGLAKGYSCVEILWNTAAVPWMPAVYKWREPRHFQFDKETGQDLRIRDNDHEEGLELNEYCWIIHRPLLKSGLPVRAGLARLVVWCFMLKSYTLQDWAAFLEIFGMPLRLGRYDDTASADEKRVLLRAVRELSSDAAAIIPKTMEVEFIQSTGGSGNAVFATMTDYLDKQISKAVIGQTMTTDEGSSRAQSEVHDEVRDDIKKADARQITTTVNRDLIVPFVGLNWGWEVTPPQVTFAIADVEDLAALTTALEKLVPLGLRVAMSDISTKFGLRVPEDDEEILTFFTYAPDEGTKDSHKASAQPCANCGEVHTHLASAQDDDDVLIMDALDDWHIDLGPLTGQIMAAAEQASSYDGFLAALDGISPDTEALRKRLAALMMKARGAGDVDG